METEYPEEGVVSLVGEISGVSLPLGERFLRPAVPLVSEGDEVGYGQKIGAPADEGLSVGVWSSMEDGIVAISGGALPHREAEAEAEARR